LINGAAVSRLEMPSFEDLHRPHFSKSSQLCY
jgi:hypothetical protein